MGPRSIWLYWWHLQIAGAICGSWWHLPGFMPAPLTSLSSLLPTVVLLDFAKAQGELGWLTQPYGRGVSTWGPRHPGPHRRWGHHWGWGWEWGHL